ncbi:MAG: hypothetical protein KDA89_08295, partial [Planctomycetaceae bacterium]|nr:hypothetical protein [Planctomycetaceae bacterium]
CFAAELRQNLAPGFSLGMERKTRSISRETATATFFDDISALLSPFHGFTFHSNIFPQAEAWGYVLPPLRGEITKKFPTESRCKTKFLTPQASPSSIGAATRLTWHLPCANSFPLVASSKGRSQNGGWVETRQNTRVPCAHPTS